MQASNSKNFLELMIQNREEVIFEGRVSTISSYNEKGKFDILPQHANFISLLNKSLEYTTTNGQSQEIPVSNGILKVAQNKVEIYLGIGE